MAHMVMGFDKGFSKGAPWHIGDTRDRWTVGRELLTPDEAAEIGWARQDKQPGIWNPMIIPVYARYGSGPNDYVSIPDSFHVARDDLPLDSPDRFISAGRGVSGKFQLITNEDIRDYCNALTDAGAFVDACGSIRNGQRVWMSLALPKGADIVDEPAVNHMLLTTAHDGTACFEAILAVMLTVCHNTMQWNRRNAQTREKIRHTTNATNRLAEAERIIKVAEANFASTVDIFRNLAMKQLSDDAAKAFFEKLNGETKRAENVTNRMLELYHGEQLGATNNSRNGTLFGAVNAASQYIETEMTLRIRKDDDGYQRDENEARMESVVFGAGARKRDQALNLAVAML